MDLKGTTALVTGGADGIGAGIAERLAAERMRVVIADLDEEAGQATAVRIGGLFVRADVADEDDIRTAFDAAGQVAVLVNNAGGIEEPCFPGEPRRLLPLTDGQMGLPARRSSAQRGLDEAAEGDELLFTAGRAD